MILQSNLFSIAKLTITALIFVAQPVIATTWLDIDEDESYIPRHESAFVQAGDRFYSFGGRESPQVLDTYDFNNDSWTTSARAPLQFNHFQATEYQGHVWIIGAFKDNRFPREAPAENIYTFDPANNFWLQGREIPEDRRRGSAGLVEYQGKFYVVGGNTIGHRGGYVSWFDEYNPQTGEWTALEDAPSQRDHFAAAVVDDKLYVAGGRLSGGDGGIFAPLIETVDVYDFASGSWSTLPSVSNIPTPRAGTSTVAFQGNVLVIGGEADGQAYDTVEQLDPDTNTWTEIAPMNHARHGTQAVVSGNGIFTLGGSPMLGGGNQRNLEAFNSSQAVGVANTPALLAAPGEDVVIPLNDTIAVEISHTSGNQGALITAIELINNESGSFVLTEQGTLPNMVTVGGSKSVMVRSTTGNLGELADLLITYDNDRTLNIPIRTPFETNGAEPVTNLLVNGSFESVSFNRNFVITNAFDGWDKNGNGALEFWSSGFQEQTAQDGNVLVELDVTRNTVDVISQSVTTVQGQPYDLSLYLRARGSTASSANELVVLWNDQEISRLIGGDSWVEATQVVIGTGFDTVSLSETAQSNTGTGTHIDNISLRPRPTNLALGKTASQISTAFGGVAERAVDGVTIGNYRAGSVTHTAMADQTWWQVDLADQSTIDSVIIHNRTDACCTARLSNFYVLIDDQPFGNRSLSELLNDSTVARSFHSSLSGSSLEIDFSNAQGRYVRVQLANRGELNLAEVRVLGIQ